VSPTFRALLGREIVRESSTARDLVSNLFMTLILPNRADLHKRYKQNTKLGINLVQTRKFMVKGV
jgi:hypothetical protein